MPENISGQVAAHPGQVKYWTVPTPLQGNIFCFGRVGCLDENTKIQIYEDEKLINKKLKDLPEYFLVDSYNFERNRFEIQKAHKVVSEVKKGLKITFEDGTSVITSKEHVFFDTIGKEIQAQDFKIGDKLLKIWGETKC